MKKIVISLMCVALLCGCVATENNTENSTADSTTNVAQTTLQADAVSNVATSYSTDKVIWGPGRGENHQQPADPISLQKQYSPLGAKFLLDDEKSICLTFDEGYENGFTPSILDTLKEKNIKAIFFVTYDFAKDNPDLIQRMIDEGHIVGNHSYRHYSMDEVSEDVAKEEITYLDNYIKDNFNYKMTLFRFPKGEFSENTLAIANDLGYKSIFWSFAYEDWDTQNPPDKTQAYNTITTYTHSGEIMLLHAVSQTNAEILGDVIDEVKNQGYVFTVDV